MTLRRQFQDFISYAAVIVVCCTYLVLPVSAESSVNQLSVDSHEQTLTIYYLDNEVLPDSITGVTKLSADKWQAHHGSSLYSGNSEGNAKWIKVVVQKDVNTPDYWQLSIDWPLLNLVEWYVYSSTGELISDGVVPAWNIPEEMTYKHPFSIPVYIDNSEPHSVYLRIAATEKFIVPLTFRTEQQITDHIINSNILNGIIFGVFFAMFFYNLSLGIFTKHGSYFAYSLFVLSTINYTFIFSGTAISLQIFPEWLFEHAFRLTLPVSHLTGIWFIRRFLELEKHNKFLDYTNRLWLFLWASIFLSGAILPASFNIQLLDIVSAVSCIYIISLTSYLWHKGEKSAKYLTISWLLLIITTLIHTLSLTGVIPYNVELYYLQNSGAVCEVLLLSIALAERINRERNKRYQAQKLALALSEEAAISRDNEMQAKEYALKVERTARDQLENKVSEKTKELKRAMEKLQIMNQELENLSRTDPLTGLANRRHFENRFKEELPRAVRMQTRLGLLMLDIDNFKKINDTFGHQAGDKVIQSVGALLQRVSGRASDLPARIGGEEFCLLVCDHVPGSINILAEKIRAGAEKEPVVAQNKAIAYTVSIGVISLIPDSQTSSDTMVKLADDALYRAKENGRNCIVDSCQIAN